MSTMLYILGVALVVFVFLGYVRRVRRPELLRAPSALGTCPGAPCTRYRSMTGRSTSSHASTL